VGRLGGPIPDALLRMLFPFPMTLAAIFGLCEKDEDAGVVAVTPSGEDDREEVGVADRSKRDVDDSRSLDGIFVWEFAEGE
jgi:hypothetical protein